MYIDTQTKLIFGELPEIYNERKISNCNSLTDEELAQLDIFKCSGFVEDEDYSTYLFLSGTEYYKGSYFTFNKVDDKIKVTANISEIKNYLTEVLQRNFRNYNNIQDMILNFPKSNSTTNITKEEFIEYDYDASYAFIFFGNSTLVDQGENKVSLKRIKPTQFPNVKVGDLVEQSTGFSATVSLVIPEKDIIKLTNCKNINLLDRTLPINVGGLTINSTDIFAYELYLMAGFVNKKPVPKDYSRNLAGQKFNELLFRTLYTTPELTYLENYSFRLTDETKTFYHVDTNVDKFTSKPGQRNYIITDYGRQE